MANETEQVGKARRAGRWALRQAGKLVGPAPINIAAGVTRDIPEVKALCKTLRENMDKLSPTQLIEIMKYIYLHLKTGKGVDKETAGKLNEMLEKMYLKPGVISHMEGSTDSLVSRGFKHHPSLRDYMKGVVRQSLKDAGVSADRYIKRVQTRGLVSLTDDQMIAAARIIGSRHGAPVSRISMVLTGNRATLTAAEQAALLLELHSTNLVSRNAILNESNLLFDEVDRSLAALKRPGDKVRNKVVEELVTTVKDAKLKSAEGATASSAEAVVASVFKDDKTKKAVTAEFERGINQREAEAVSRAKAAETNDVQAIKQSVRQKVEAVQQRSRDEVAALRSQQGKTIEEISAEVQAAKKRAADKVKEIGKNGRAEVKRVQDAAKGKIEAAKTAAQNAKSKLAEFLGTVSQATDADAMRTALARPSTQETRTLGGFLREITDNQRLMHAMDGLRVLEEASGETGKAVRAGVRARGKFAMSLWTGFKTRARSVASRLAPVGKALIFLPAKAYGEFAEAVRVKGARPRRILRGTGWALLTGAVVLGAYYGLHYVFVTRPGKKADAIRMDLAKEWRVYLSRETYRNMHSSKLAEGFFEQWLNFAHIKKLGSIVPQNEKGLISLLGRKDRFINPVRVADLALEVKQHINWMKKLGKSDSQIQASLDGRAKGDWRKKGYFLTPGEVYVEQLKKDLNLERPIANYLKEDRNFLVLLWTGIRDGSLPRSFTADIARAMFADKAVLKKLRQVVIDRAKITPAYKRPSVSQSLENAGISYPDFLLKHRIPEGSLLDVYDQWATVHPKIWLSKFKQMLQKYQTDKDVRQRLDNFTLKDDEAVYGNIASLAEAVAEGRWDYNRAKKEFVVASDVFERLGMTRKKLTAKQEKDLIRFAYRHSDRARAGIVRWLDRNKEHIIDVVKILRYLQERSALLENKSPAEVEKIVIGMTGDFKKNKMYRKAAEPFAGKAIRDTFPRPIFIEEKEVEAQPSIPEEAKRLWESKGIEELKKIVMSVATDRVVRGSLAERESSSKRIAETLKAMSLRGRDQRARDNLVKLFERRKWEAVRKLRKNSAAFRILTDAIKQDIGAFAPEIFYGFFKDEVVAKKREKELGVKVTLEQGRIGSIEITDFAKLKKISKEITLYFNNKYKLR